MSNRLKPHLKDINISSLKPEQLEYFCKTQVIDKIILERRGEAFNQKMADEMEIRMKYYLIVKTDMQYDVISGFKMDPWLEENNIADIPISDKAKECMNHYIRSLK